MGKDTNTIENLNAKIEQLQERITQLERIEKQNNQIIEVLKSSENKLDTIFNVAPTGIGLVCDRIFLDANPLMCKITGYTENELIGRDTAFIYPGKEVYEAVGNEIYQQVAQKGSGIIETVWKRKDGNLIDVFISLTPLNADDLDAGILFTVQDISAQKKAKQLLESSEQRLKIIFDHAPDAIYLCDENGVFVDVNNAAAQMVGRDKSDLIGQCLFDPFLMDDTNVCIARELLQKNKRGAQTEPTLLEVFSATKDRISIEVTSYPVSIAGKDLVLGIARNVTERIRAEKRKRENEQRFSFHYNQTKLAFIEWTLDFTVKNWNPAAEKIFGYSKEEALGQHASLIVAKSSREEVEQMWSQMLRSKSEGKITNRNRTKNGEIILCDWHNTLLKNDDGEAIAVASLAMDVTETVRAEEIRRVIYNISNAVNSTENLNKLIHQIREELGSIIDTTNFYIALYDENTDTLSLPFFADEKDAFESFPAGKSLTGHVVRTNKPLLANHEQMQELEEKGIVESMGSNSKIWLGVPLEIENKVIGALVVQSYTNAKAFNEADMEMLEFASDQISLSIHRKNTEVKMAEAVEKATESDRLKSSFLANMSHEIRTPMNGILGFASLLKTSDISEEDRNKYISIIEQSGKRMLGIINDLIDISKIESGMIELNISDFNLNNSLEYVYSFFKPEAEAKGLQLSYSTPESNQNALVQSDREKVYAILINLVKNAIKYTRSGHIDFGYVIQDNRIRFKVKDTGIGIPYAQQEAIFNRFVQSDLSLSSSYEGVGLGLAITKAYIQLLDGRIWVESAPQQGSTFYVEIPYQKGNFKVNNTEETENKRMQDKQKIKILLAEDDAINRKLFSYILKEISSELIETVNGREAVDKHAETSDIDLILMDLKMPEMDGYEATQLIREKDKDIKIIGLSAFAFETEKQKALDGGFSDYVAKPVSKANLLSTIQKYFEV